MATIKCYVSECENRCKLYKYCDADMLCGEHLNAGFTTYHNIRDPNDRYEHIDQRVKRDALCKFFDIKEKHSFYNMVQEYYDEDVVYFIDNYILHTNTFSRKSFIIYKWVPSTHLLMQECGNEGLLHRIQTGYITVFCKDIQSMIFDYIILLSL